MFNKIKVWLDPGDSHSDQHDIVAAMFYFTKKPVTYMQSSNIFTKLSEINKEKKLFTLFFLQTHHVKKVC